MAAPSNNVSLRITDDEIALLDARVGVDGARSRSDAVSSTHLTLPTTPYV